MKTLPLNDKPSPVQSTVPGLATEELAALLGISQDLAKARKPRLPRSYWYATAFVVGTAFAFGIAAAAAPGFVTEYLLLASAEDSPWFNGMTRVRGWVALFLCSLFLAAWAKAPRIADAMVLLALAWSSAMTLADLYKLYVLQLFESNFGSSLFLFMRPLIFASLTHMTLARRRYRRALEAWKLQVSD
jgi:hypothetical protein